MNLGWRIAEHRRSRGMTGEELGRRVGLSKSQISRIESGQRQPGLTDLAYIADVFGTTVDSLLGVEPAGSVALAARVMRDDLGADEKVGPMRRRMAQLLDLHSVLVGLSGLGRAPISCAGRELIGSVPAACDGETAADAVRAGLGLGRAAISDVGLLAEEHFGVDVAGWPSPGSIDGLCARSGDLAVLLVNTAATEGQARFTAAHELAHHLFADPRPVIAETTASNSAVETRANRFAAALLLPAEGVHETVGSRRVDEETVSDLMRFYRASYQATIIRLNDLRLIASRDKETWLARRPSNVLREGGDPNPAELLGTLSGDKAKQPPRRLWRHAQTAYTEGRVSIGVLAGLADESPDDLLGTLTERCILAPAAADDLDGL